MHVVFRCRCDTCKCVVCAKVCEWCVVYVSVVCVNVMYVCVSGIACECVRMCVCGMYMPAHVCECGVCECGVCVV